MIQERRKDRQPRPELEKDWDEAPAAPQAVAGKVEVPSLTKDQISKLAREHACGTLSMSVIVSDVCRLIAAAPAAPVAAVPQQPRPTDDHLWDETIRDRDTYHEWADKLAGAIAKHFNAYIGEHSNMNCPWSEALDVIENAAAPATVPAELDEQAAFEAWYEPMFGKQMRLGDSGQYYLQSTQGAWHAWQARASLSSPAERQEAEGRKPSDCSGCDPAEGFCRACREAEQQQAEPGMLEAYKVWLASRGPLGVGAAPERVFFAGWLACRRAAPASAEPVQVPGDDQWIFDLAAKHESRGREYFGPITFSSTAIVDFVRDVAARLAAPSSPSVLNVSRQAMIESALRQIIEADDDQGLTQDLIEAGRRALAWRDSSPSVSGTVDTPELMAVVLDYVRVLNGKYGNPETAYRALIAHIDQHTAQAVRAAREEALEELAKSVLANLVPGKTADLPIQWVAHNAAIMNAAETARALKRAPQAAGTEQGEKQ